MRRSFAAALVVALALGGTTLLASPANAAPQPLFGTTVDVIAQPSGDSLIGGTAYVPVGGGSLVPTLTATLGSDLEVSVLDGATTLASCTIFSGDLACGIATVGLFSAGATLVTMRFVLGPTTIDYTGTVFAVTNSAPSVSIEWQDASGAWVDGSGVGLPFFGDIALRCVVTNNSNAPVTFDSFDASVADLGGSEGVPITGTLAAGETGIYELWSGSVSLNPFVSCGGGVELSDGTGAGNGTGGGTIPIGGTIAVAPTPAPGATVTVTGEALIPPVVTSYTVLLDGVEVAGSPVTTTGPDFDFSIDVAIPASLGPGMHAITVQVTFAGRDIAFAYFPFEVSQPELAATGPHLTTPLSIAGLLFVVGLVTIVASRRRRTA